MARPPLLRLLPVLLLAVATLSFAAGSGTADYGPSAASLTGRLLVRRRAGAPGWAHPRGTAYLRQDEASGLGLLSILDGTPAERKAADIQRSGEFEFVELDHHVSLHSALERAAGGGVAGACATSHVDDNLWLYQWGAQAIRADSAWCASTGAGVTVAVVDTGVDTTHPDLRGSLWVNQAEAVGLEGVDDDGNGFVDDVHGYDFVSDTGQMVDDHGHGTHVAGIIAGAMNGGGVVGVAPAAKVMALRFIDSDGNAPISQAVFAVLYAIAQGADVISNSWGSRVKSRALETVFGLTVAGGQVVVCSSGNGGLSLDGDAVLNYPASFRLPNMITVGAVSATMQRYSSSNYGVLSVDLSAPGTDVLSTSPVFKGAYEAATGTSQSVPHVSGVAALVAATRQASLAAGARPSLQRALWVKNVLLRSAAYVPALAPFVRTAGMVDAYRAVYLAQHGDLPTDGPLIRPGKR